MTTTPPKDDNKYEMSSELLERAKEVIIDYVKNGYPNGTTYVELERELSSCIKQEQT